MKNYKNVYKFPSDVQEPTIPCDLDCSNCSFMSCLLDYDPRIVIGSDPEFNIVEPATGRIHVFKDFMHHFEDVQYPCNDGENCSYEDGDCSPNERCPLRGESDDETSRRIGLDGCGTTGEIRPIESECPMQHARNIDSLIQDIEKDLPKGLTEYRVIGGPYPSEPAGGHVHFSRQSGRDLYNRTGIFMDSLAYYLAIPLDCLFEQSKCRQRRDGTSYGKLGSDGIRCAEDHTGYEFRVPPSWMIDIQLMESVLSLTKVAVHAIEYAPHKYEVELPRRLKFSYDRVRRNEFTTANALKALDEVRNMPLYPLFSKRIELLAGMVVQGLQWTNKPYGKARIRPFKQNTIQRELILKVLKEGVEEIAEKGKYFGVQITLNRDQGLSNLDRHLNDDEEFLLVCDDNQIEKLYILGLSSSRGALFHVSYNLITGRSDPLEGTRIRAAGTWDCVSSFQWGVPELNQLIVGIPRHVRDEFNTRNLVQIIKEIIQVQGHRQTRAELACPICGHMWSVPSDSPGSFVCDECSHECTLGGGN